MTVNSILQAHAIERVQLPPATQPAHTKQARGQVTLHPQGGGDLRLLAMYAAPVVDSLRRASFSRAQQMKSAMAESQI